MQRRDDAAEPDLESKRLVSRATQWSGPALTTIPCIKEESFGIHEPRHVVQGMKWPSPATIMPHKTRYKQTTYDPHIDHAFDGSNEQALKPMCGILDG